MEIFGLSQLPDRGGRALVVPYLELYSPDTVFIRIHVLPPI